MKNYKGQYAHKQYRAKRFLIAMIVLSVTFAGYYEWSMYSPEYAIAEVNITKPVEDDRTIQEHVWQLLENEFNMDFNERVIAMSIIQCESNWNSYAINKNTNGTYDLGIWQINSVHNIDRECAFDIYCSTREAMKIYKASGNSFRAWVCYNK